MKSKIVSKSLPCFIYDFKENKELSPNKYVTPAKLKMFYTGVTADKRRFTEEFAEKLIKTLVHTPVVAFYDSESEDFKGHNSTQYIYGIVPEQSNITFEKDDNGVKWAIADVILYTGRNDNIGKVAQKIIGKQHSLELDPDSVKYNMVIENGYLKEIVFLEGSFIGLSVLGDNERPAFSGSTFFTEEDLEIFTKMCNIDGGEMEDKEVINTSEPVLEEPQVEEKVENESEEKSLEDQHNEDSTVIAENEEKTEVEETEVEEKVIEEKEAEQASENEETPVVEEQGDSSFEEIQQFMNRSFEEESRVLIKEFVNSSVVSQDDGYIFDVGHNFVVFRCWNNSLIKFEKVDESNWKKEEVFIYYLNESEKQNYSNYLLNSEEQAEEKTSETKEVEDEEKQQEAEFSVAATPLNDEEREELNNYRIKEKEEIINKFVSCIKESDLEDIRNHLDDYSVIELKKELAFKKVEKEFEEEEKRNNNSVSSIFALNINNEPKSDIDELINRYKDR